MNETTLFKLIIPDQILLECSAKMIVMPGEDGEFGVLPGHETLIANLKEGIVKISTIDTESRYFIPGGIAQITGTEVNLVTEFAQKI